MSRSRTWAEAIIKVLEDAGEPMDYNQVTQVIIDEGLRDVSSSVTPARTVNARIGQEIRTNGDASRLVRVGRGLVGLREWEALAAARRDRSLAGNLPSVSQRSMDGADLEQVESSTGIVTSFGLFWRREEVDWASRSAKTGPSLLGATQLGAKPVDFAAQSGVYILYDGSRPVYAGQVAKPRLSLRLFEHTRDRLNGRWQRFSWFGVRCVGEDGTLTDPDVSAMSLESIIDALEAILIEGVEPAQNRRGGNSFGTEYLQVEDPNIAQKRRVALLREMESRV